MVDAVKHHLRHTKTKLGTCGSVSKDDVNENAPINGRFYGSVMKVLDYGLVRVKWKVDNTSLVTPSAFQIDEAAKNGPLPENYAQEQTVTKKKENKRATCIRYKQLFDSQFHNLSRRQLLAQCELQVATTETDEMVVIDQIEKLEMMSSSDKM